MAAATMNELNPLWIRIFRWRRLIVTITICSFILVTLLAFAGLNVGRVQVPGSFIRDISSWLVLISGCSAGLIVGWLLDIALKSSAQMQQVARKQQRSLQLTEEQLALAVHGGNVGLWEWDAETDAIQFSDLYLAQVGHEPGAWKTFQEWSENIHPEDQDLAMQRVQDYLTHKSDQYINTFRIRHKNGSYLWVRAQGLAQFDSEGKPIRGHGVQVDISELKQIEERLDRERSETRQIIDAVPSLIYVKDLKNEILRANKAFAESVGRTVEEIEHQTFQSDEALNPSISSGFDQQAINSRQPILGKTEILGDRIVQTDRIPLNNSEGKVDRVLVVATDITDSIALTESLRLSQERMELALQGADLGTWDWDIPSGEVQFNERWAEMLGYRLDEIEGKLSTWERLVHPEDMPAIEKTLQAHLEGKTPYYETEHRVLHKDGHWVWVLDKGCVISRDSSGAPLRACGTHLDITPKKQAEQETLELNRRLEETIAALEVSNQDLKQFAYVASHDLQSPLSVVSGYANILVEHYADHLDEEAVGFIQRILATCARMRTMIDDLLQYSKIESSGTQSFVEVSLNEIVDRLKGLFESSANTVTGKVTRDSLPVIEGDLPQIESLFQNLIQNGLKYNKSETPKVHVSSTEDDDFYTLTIQDNGIGISAQQQDVVFELFKRLHTNEEYPGSGIGLASCRRIVQRHRGEIDLQSEVGTGSTFTIRIPKKKSLSALQASSETVES